MKAVVIDRFGGLETLKLSDVPTPTAKEGEVLVQVKYAGVNPVDWKMREGYLKDFFPHHFPLILGWEAAGVVVEAGKNVTKFKKGEKVYAYCRKPEVQWGAYAEYLTLDESAVSKMPSNLSFAQAAAIPLTGLTAWQAIIDFAGLRCGQTILIHAGAGGVGGMAIQFAKHVGAKVYTTARRENHAYVKQLGADLPIDYRAGDFLNVIHEAESDGVDVVLDSIGGDTLEKSYGAVRKGGTLISLVDEPDQGRLTAKGARAFFAFVDPRGDQLEHIAALVESGAVQPPALEEFPLEEVRRAHEKIQTGHTRGKIVLRIS